MRAGFSQPRRLGVMGGMFDPVHHGHLRTALAVKEALGLDRVQLIPCRSPVHRQQAEASCQHRLAMLELAVIGEDSLAVDDRECRRQGPSYAYDTLSSLAEEYPQASLHYLMGADSFNTLTTWHRWQDLLQLCHLIVVSRPGWKISAAGELGDVLAAARVPDAKDLLETGRGRIHVCEMEPLMISSSHIRALLGRGQSPRYLLPDAVLDYIEQYQLYAPEAPLE